MSIQEARRAAFVDAFITKFGFGPMAASSNAEAQQMLEAAEWAWNAALDSVVVELPAVREIRYGRCGNEYDSGVNFGVELSREAIEATGIRAEMKS